MSPRSVASILFVCLFKRRLKEEMFCFRVAVRHRLTVTWAPRWPQSVWNGWWSSWCRPNRKTVRACHVSQHNTTRHDTTRPDPTRHDPTRPNTTQPNTTQHGTSRHVTSRHVTSRHVTSRHGTTQHNTTQHNTTQHINLL